MKRLIFYIIFCPFFLFAQEVILQVPEVNLIENKLDLHQIGAQQWLLDSTLSKHTHSLSDYLRHHGPIFVKEYGALSSASYRGTPASHTQLIWNGISLNSLSTGQVDLGLFPTAIFSEIKLNSGGHSTLSGSGAIGGSIQLNNVLQFNPENSWEVDWSKGSFGLENQSFSYRFGDGGTALHLQYLTSISQNDFDYVNNGLPGSPLENQEHAYKESKQYLLNYGYRNDKSQLGLYFWNSDNFREVPVGMLSSNPNAKQWDNALRTKVFWKQFGEDYQLELVHAYIEEDFLYTSNFVDSRLETKNHFSSLDYQRHYNSLSAYLGANLQHKIVSSNYYKEEADEQVLVGYTSLKYRAGKWISIASLRGEIHPVYKVPALYSFGTNYRLSDQWIWKLNLTKNFKAPTFNDLYWVGDGAMGNTDLLPELAYAAETTLEHKDISFTLYSNWIQQMIQWQPNVSGVFWMPQNLESVWARGLELKRTVSKSLGKLKVSTLAAYTFTLSTLKESELLNDGGIGQQLMYVPIHKTSSITHFDIDQWRITVSSAYNGKVNTTSDGSSTLPSYALVDCILQYQSKQAALVLSAKINNVTNKSYQVYEWFPMPGRHLILTINLKF